MRTGPTQEQRILSELRQQIVSGKLPPGGRLPTRAELQRTFGITPPILQRAVTRLMRDGFVVARGKLGTFVTDHPPHLHHYGLVFVGDPTQPWQQEVNSFSTLLYRTAVEMRRRGERNISTYHSINGQIDREDYLRLHDHIQAQRLAGLIFDLPLFGADSPAAQLLLDTPELPCVMLADRLAEHPNLSVIHLLDERLRDRALDYLREHGCRGVALLVAGMDDHRIRHFAEGVAARGMTTYPYWIQCVHPSSARAARNCAHGLMRMQERPDALLITDDILVPHATAGLVDARIRVPEELTVVAHCNYPHVTPSAVRAKRIGFDVRAVLAACCDVIDCRRRGEPPPVPEIAPWFDHEIAGKTPVHQPATFAT